MSSSKQTGLSDLAVDRLEQSGFLPNIRAEMKAEVMKCLLEMEDQNEIPQHLKLKRFTPKDDKDLEALSYIAEFMRFHGLQNSLSCLMSETNADIPTLRGGGQHSELSEAISRHADEEENPLFKD